MLGHSQKTPPRIKLLSMLIAVALGQVITPALAAVEISQKPLFLGRNAPPLNQLIVGRDHKLYYEAYNDASDLDGDGVLDVRFNPNITYYGYFDSKVCYTHNAGSDNTGLFTPAGNAGALNTCSGQWSGNWLNYATTTRIDALRKVLYGGHREVDSKTKTILRRSYIPQDAHSWAKEYTSTAVDGYDIGSYTPLSQPASGKRHFFGNLTANAGKDCSTLNTCSDLPPWLSVVKDSSKRVWEWASTERPVLRDNTHGGTRTNYTVRVEVCTDTYHGDSCYKYPDGDWKPIGLQQDYGENNSMMFGLLTGSYDKNMSGGVLRKAMSSFTDEIDPQTGQFTTTNGIVSNLNALRIRDYNNGRTDNAYRGGWVTTRPMKEGEFYDWGNPIAEIMYEGLRYFAGKKAATAAFAGGSVDTSMGLTNAVWDDPYEFEAKADDTPQKGFPWCSRPFQLVISDINPSFDSDQVPGGYFGGSGDLSIGAESLLNTITASEPTVAGLHFIGQSGTIFDGAPTAKNVASLGSIRGLAPEEPTKQGSYNAAAVAFYGKTHDLSSTAKNDQKVDAFMVALASPLPRIEFPTGNGTVTLVPFAKSVGGSGISAASDKFQPTNQIVDFYVDKIVNLPGSPVDATVNGGRPYAKFQINYEDVEQGADHDMDAIVDYTIQLTAGGQVDVTLDSTYAAGGIIHHMGYIISGTTADGVYLEVRDKDTAEANDPDYYLDTPNTPSVALPLNANRVFTASNRPAATLLQNPLWYAAKWGGFNDANSDGKPDSTAEWDANGDGVPDSYFLVQNPLNLKKALESVFDGIISKSTSQSSVGASTTGSINADSAIYVAGFDPMRWSGAMAGIKFNFSGLPCAAGDNASTGCTWPSSSWRAENVIPSPASRNIKFWRANPPSPQLPGEQNFTWATLTADEKLLFADTANPTGNPAIVEYLRGVRTHEIPKGTAKDNLPPTATEYLRTRVSPLGDIVNSDPVFVGTADAAQRKYERRTSISAANQASFITYVAASASRTKMVYVGANDGMLHGFNATTGVETFAYMPAEVFARIKALSQPKIGETGQPYSDHQYYVDGKIGVGDALIDGVWKTILVGSTGAGGKTLFALDVTDPENIDVMWEFTNDDLGQVRGKPQVILLDDGTWATVVGNGYNSTNSKANLIVVNLKTGALIKSLAGVIATGEESNGLAQIAGWDDGNDGDIDYFYGGDLLGRLWKFNVTGNNSATWSSQHMFTTTDNNAISAKAQPITGGVNVALNPNDGFRYVFFGTGRYMGASDVTDMQINALYGIQDTGSSVSFSDLKERKIIYDWTAGGLIGLQRTLAIEAAVTGDMVGRKGWYVPLSSDIVTRKAEGQRVYGTPLVYGKVLVTSVNIPVEDPCSPGGISYNLAIDLFTGSRLNFNFYDINKDGVVDAGDSYILDGDGKQVETSGIYFDALSADPAVMGDRLLIGLSDGTYENIKTNSGLKKGRLSWREILR
jgi:type IV pilus assembly protein PilY1